MGTQDSYHILQVPPNPGNRELLYFVNSSLLNLSPYFFASKYFFLHPILISELTACSFLQEFFLVIHIRFLIFSLLFSQHLLAVYYLISQKMVLQYQFQFVLDSFKELSHLHLHLPQIFFLFQILTFALVLLLHQFFHLNTDSIPQYIRLPKYQNLQSFQLQFHSSSQILFYLKFYPFIFTFLFM